MSGDILPGDSSEDGEDLTKRPPVPYVPGGFDPVRSNVFIGPLPWPPYEEPVEAPASPNTPSRLRMWAAAGAVVAVSVASAGWAFHARGSGEAAPPSVPCQATAVSELADGTVSVRLTNPAGREKVWVGNDLGVMEAQQTPADPNVYSFNANGYLHNDIIGTYVGGVVCSGRFNLGSVQPGDEVFFAGS